MGAPPDNNEKSGFLQYHFDRVIGFVEFYQDIFFAAGGDIAADEVGADRQFPVATVDKDRELYALWPAVIHHGIHGGPNGSAGEKDVIHQDNILPFDTERDFGFSDRKMGRLSFEVVPVEGYVNRADRDGNSFDLLQSGGQFESQIISTSPDSDQYQVGNSLVPLQDLVSNSG
jgi:hypothetical protein